jgi:hypothetical protein
MPKRLLFAAVLFGLAATGFAQTPADGPACVQVQIAGQAAPAFACLNQELQSQAQAAHQAPRIAAPLGAGGPSNATGTFNQTGVAQQYGKNFGSSVIPYRPPPPVFTNPTH